MKSIYPIISLFLPFSLLFPSCDQKDLNSIDNVDNGICTFSFNPTESEYSHGWIAGDIIGVSVYKSGTNEIYFNYADKQYITNNDYFFSPATDEDRIVRPLSENEVDYIAYFPYKTIASEKYPIDLRDQSSQKNIDFLFSNNANNKTNSSKNVKLIFDHVLSKIIINSIPGEGYTDKDLEGAQITINNINVLAVFDIRTELFDVYMGNLSIIMNQEDNIKNEAILLPGLYSDASLTIRLTNSHTYEAWFPKSQYFNSRTIYHYNLIINKASVELNSIEIADWAGVNEIPDTCISNNHSYKIGDFYPIPDDPKTAIGIVYWVMPGTNGREGKIVSFDTDTLKWSESNNYQLGTSIAVGTNNIAVVREIDPTLQEFPAFKWCADKGDGWYLPARYELHVLNKQWISNKEKINNNIQLAGGEILLETDIYLASSESRSYPNNYVETYNFEDKGWPSVEKNTHQRIRAVKFF